MLIVGVVTNPNEVVYEIRVSMPLKHWRELMKQLPTEWPSSDLSMKLRDVIRQAEQTFYPKEPNE